MFLALLGFTNLWSLKPTNKKISALPDPAAYLGQTPPGEKPEVFAPGIVSLARGLKPIRHFRRTERNCISVSSTPPGVKEKYYGPGWKTEHGPNRRRRLFRMAGLSIGNRSSPRTGKECFSLPTVRLLPAWIFGWSNGRRMRRGPLRSVCLSPSIPPQKTGPPVS